MNRLPRVLCEQIAREVGFPDLWRLAMVNRGWYGIVYDGYLYREIVLERLELKVLLKAIDFILRRTQSVRVLKIRHCWSSFVQDTVVPVPFSGPGLLAPIRHLALERRREAYARYGFDLHQRLGRQLGRMCGSLREVTIVDCPGLDMEMTGVFGLWISKGGDSLERLEYDRNGDRGLGEKEFQAFVQATPNLRHFLGRHAGMTEHVGLWKELESLTISGDGFGAQSLGELLGRLRKLRRLELDDLACLTNKALARMAPSLSPLCHLCVTKYVTPPLSTPGFNDLLRLFPNLASLEYVTNFNTFHHQFEGVTLDLFEAERQSVDGVMKRQNMNYVGQWHQPMTHEQRLTASLLRI